MRCYRVMTGLAAAAVAVAATVLAAGPALAAVTWTVVPSPPPASAFWTAVSARTDTDAWVVAQGSATTPLTARWNGTSWSQVPGPVVTGATQTVLNAVSAATASDAWAVGRSTRSRHTSSLAVHWDGTSWTAMPGLPGSVLTAVDDVSPGNAYAVGEGTALHWNGTAWSAFSVPTPGSPAVVLDAVASDSASDVWITGIYPDTVTMADQPFSAHWNGTAWTAVPMPADQGEFFGLTVLSPTDIWAVGEANGLPVTENWNGSSWRVIPNPVQGTAGILLKVTATGPGNVTAAGHNSTANGPTQAIILTWNGSSWSNDTVPVVGATEELFSASAAPGGAIRWALGSSTSSGGVTSSLLLRNG